MELSGLIVGILGIVLLIFGGLVLLQFPDKPGGTISIAGVHVSSASAGLPLIVFGAVLVVLAAMRWQGHSPASGQASPAPTDSRRGASNQAVVPSRCAATQDAATAPSPMTTLELGSGARQLMCDQRRSSRGAAVTLSVEDIVQRGNTLEVYLKAENKGGTPVVMPTTSFFVNDAHTGKSYVIDLRQARWPQTVPPEHGKVTGMIPIAEPLDPNASQLDIGFTRIDGSSQDQSVKVGGIRLRSR